MPWETSLPGKPESGTSAIPPDGMQSRLGGARPSKLDREAQAPCDGTGPHPGSAWRRPSRGRIGRIGSWWYDGVQPAPHPNDSAGLGVVGQKRFLPSCPNSPREVRYAANSSPVKTGWRRKNASCFTTGTLDFLSRFPGFCYGFDLLSQSPVGELMIAHKSHNYNMGFRV